MHDSSFRAMEKMVKTYLNEAQMLSILDVGSLNIRANSGDYFLYEREGAILDGSYRNIFLKSNWIYTGLDISPGSNVDIVSVNPYNWPIEDSKYDVVISGQCLEHIEKPWVWITEIERVCKPGGIVILIAPWNCGEHRYPIDCWRILPDGMNVLLTKCAKMTMLYCKVENETDTVAVAKNGA